MLCDNIVSKGVEMTEKSQTNGGFSVVRNAAGLCFRPLLRASLWISGMRDETDRLIFCRFAAQNDKKQLIFRMVSAIMVDNSYGRFADWTLIERVEKP